MHGFPHQGVLAHAKIVVGAPYRHLAAALFAEMVGGGIGPAAPLQIGEDAIAAFAMQRFQMLAKAILVVHAQLPWTSGRSPLCHLLPACLR